MNIVFEYIIEKDECRINKRLKKNDTIWVVEPFHAFHHRNKMAFYPSPFPEFVNEFINKGRIRKISAEGINTPDIYMLSADQGVGAVEKAYPTYKQKNEKIIQLAIDTVGAKEAEFVFKKNLCMRIAVFFSVNAVISKLSTIMKDEFVFYPDTNVVEYNYIKEILLKSSIPFFQHSNTLFDRKTVFLSKIESYKAKLLLLTQLFAQTFASIILSNRNPIIPPPGKKDFLYGISIFGSRQLNGDKKGADFLIDDQCICKEDVIYLPLIKLTSEQVVKLEALDSKILFSPEVGRFYSNYKAWYKLLKISLVNNYIGDNSSIKEACVLFFNYFKWGAILKIINIKHFISHCDFSTNHIGRNIALKQENVKTWYFTDSMNLSCNFKNEMQETANHHPFWTYLYYDCFVTWNRSIAEYFQSHPETFSDAKIVGCLWSKNIYEKNGVQLKERYIPEKYSHLKFVSAFDTTYTKNGITSYQEGIEFAKNILRLVEENPDIYLLLKEKKERSIHKSLNTVDGPELIKLYDLMDLHPRISVLLKGCDVSEIISISDIVISFPFTSTTFEALCARKNAIWHDPMGYYKKTPYGKTDFLVTHNYDELKAKVSEIKDDNSICQSSKTIDSSLSDPYMDGKAVERFRELLVSTVSNK